MGDEGRMMNFVSEKQVSTAAGEQKLSSTTVCWVPIWGFSWQHYEWKLLGQLAELGKSRVHGSLPASDSPPQQLTAGLPAAGRAQGSARWPPGGWDCCGGQAAVGGTRAAPFDHGKQHGPGAIRSLTWSNDPGWRRRKYECLCYAARRPRTGVRNPLRSLSHCRVTLHILDSLG